MTGHRSADSDGHRNRRSPISAIGKRHSQDFVGVRLAPFDASVGVPHLRPSVESFVGLQSVKDLDAIVTCMDLELLRVQVYPTFAGTGRAPTVADLAESVQGSPAEVQEGLQQLARNRHVVLDAAGAIVMAHPFFAVPVGFLVMSIDTLWWGGCAGDSFALPHLLGDVVPGAASVLVAISCPARNRPHAWNVDRDGPPDGDQVAHFLVPAAQMWDDVLHSCAHQRLFCSTGCVEDWLHRTGAVRGYVMDLSTLWRLAPHWYDGRLTPSCHRRDPATGADYLRMVGLSGPFWGF